MGIYTTSGLVNNKPRISRKSGDVRDNLLTNCKLCPKGIFRGQDHIIIDINNREKFGVSKYIYGAVHTEHLTEKISGVAEYG